MKKRYYVRSTNAENRDQGCFLALSEAESANHRNWEDNDGEVREDVNGCVGTGSGY